MGGAEAPFLYDHPSKSSFLGPSEKAFNPKAFSAASWTQPLPRPKQEGPLIQSKEFNRHPDSYFIVPYGNLNAKPMSPRTKSKVKWIRHVQLMLRILALVGAVGMLFCVICIKGTDAATGWIIRVPPAVAIVHTVYATYHLARSSKGRTPASSASYMLFASIIDVGLVPFLGFTAMIARVEYTEPEGSQSRWTTLFATAGADFKILYALFLVSVVNGGLHLVSLVISIYLGVVFRKISRLPPDMNPLEDNLTSRHKRNKSSLLDNSASKATTPTRQLESEADAPRMSPVRSVPFMHTRNDSHANIANVPYPNSSPRASQLNVAGCAPYYDQPASYRSSRIQLEERSPGSSPPKRASHTYLPNLMPNSSANMTTTQSAVTRSPTKASSNYSTSTNSTHPRSTAPSLPDSNWITHPSTSPSPSPPRELKQLRNKAIYQPLSQSSPFEYTSAENDENLMPLPLAMNPPTPPASQKKSKQGARALTPGTGNVSSSQGNCGPGMVGIGKARAWGAMSGGGRVVSRSGVEVRQEAIYPSGGVRAREVSGKVMEEGRGNWLTR